MPDEGDLKLSLESRDHLDNQNSDEELPLSEVIRSIIQKVGPFAEVTEDLLREKLSAHPESNAYAVTDDKSTSSQANVEPQDHDKPENLKAESKDLAEEFDRARAELIQCVGIAQNETGLALDFVSLLLSASRPQAALASMSPLLKQAVAPGSLNADSVQPNPQPQDTRANIGWKLGALRSSVESLELAQIRLKNEIKGEDIYWRSILELVTEQEVVYRHPKGSSRGLVAKYGFEYAGSLYFDKGLGIIQRGEDGTAELKLQARPQTKLVCVKLFAVDAASGEKRLIGCSSIDYLTCGKRGPLFMVRNARTLLFEEELFNAITKEAHALAPYRVTATSDSVSAHLQDEIMQIDYVSETADTKSGAASLYNERADKLAILMRILLCRIFADNLARLQKPPPPVSTKALPATNGMNQTSMVHKPRGILKPILNHVLHHRMVDRVCNSLNMILKGHQHTLDISQTPLTDLSQLYVPAKTTLTIDLQAKQCSVIIEVYAPIDSLRPIFQASAQPRLPSTSLHELVDLEEWIQWVLRSKM